MDHKQFINAEDQDWESAVRRQLELGEEVVVAHLSIEQQTFCSALAREYNYECVPLDDSQRDEYPQIQPSQVGLVKRGHLRFSRKPK